MISETNSTPNPAPSTPPVDQAVWGAGNLQNPHAAADKAMRVQHMFSAIAGSYDLNNRLHSMWQDQVWRRKAVRLCRVQAHEVVCDVACGTGDLSLAFAAAGVRRVVGIDFTHNMVRIAQHKNETAHATGAAAKLAPAAFADGDAMRLPLSDASVDVVSIAFGIRNVADPSAAMREFARILRPGGRLCILEFSLPANPVMRGLYNFYFRHIMPRTATLISRDRSGAYKYLPESVNTFLGRPQMVAMMQAAGFRDVQQNPMTFGVAVAYIGQR